MKQKTIKILEEIAIVGGIIGIAIFTYLTISLFFIFSWDNVVRIIINIVVIIILIIVFIELIWVFKRLKNKEEYILKDGKYYRRNWITKTYAKFKNVK